MTIAGCLQVWANERQSQVQFKLRTERLQSQSASIPSTSSGKSRRQENNGFQEFNGSNPLNSWNPLFYPNLSSVFINCSRHACRSAARGSHTLPLLIRAAGSSLPLSEARPSSVSHPPLRRTSLPSSLLPHS